MVVSAGPTVRAGGEDALLALHKHFVVRVPQPEPCEKSFMVELNLQQQFNDRRDVVRLLQPHASFGLLAAV